MPRGVYKHPEVCLQNLSKGWRTRKGTKNVKQKKPKNWKRAEARKVQRDKVQEDHKVDERVKDLVDSRKIDQVA